MRTSQAVNRPLFKLLKRNVCGRRVGIKVQSVRVACVFVLGCRELLLPVVHDISPFRIDAVIILAQHGHDICAVVRNC